MEPAPGPPMMTRVGGPVQPDNYDAILRQTEQDNNRPANPQSVPQGQQNSSAGMIPPAPPVQPCQYNPNVPTDNQGYNFAANMGPWAGMPGAQPAFQDESWAQPYPPQNQMQMQTQTPSSGGWSPPQPAWRVYRDCIFVAVIMFAVLRFGVPQAARHLPSVYQNPASFQTIFTASILTGCAFQAVNRFMQMPDGRILG